MDESLLGVIACPVDKSELKQIKDKLVCTKCNRDYTIKEGIPILLPENN